MAASDTRNLILALIVLIVGIQLIVFVMRAYIPVTSVDVPFFQSTVLGDIANGLSIAVGVIIILLIPVYLYQRGKRNAP